MALRLLIILAGLLFPTAAQAISWQWVSLTMRDDRRVSLYLDSESIRRNGDVVNASTMAVFDGTEQDGIRVGLNLVEFDCRRRSLIEHQAIYLDDEGKEVARTERQARERATAGSIEEAALTFVCGQRRALAENIANPIEHAMSIMTGNSAQAAVQEEPSEDSAEGISSGTGFFVGPSGAVLTAYHVVEGASEIAIRTSAGQTMSARVERVSAANDLAVLRVDTRPSNFLGFAPPGATRTGDRVFTLGYPVINLLGVSEPRFADGTVSGLSGEGGEDSWMQISVPVQPGNSGGPLLNESGQVVGIVAAQARVAAFLERTGTLPQNINWAVKAEYAAPLLGAQPPAPARTRAQGIDVARNAVVVVFARRESESNE